MAEREAAGELEEGSEGNPSVTPRVARRQMRDFLRHHEQRRRQLPRALLVGLLAGLVAVGFQFVLAKANHLRDWIIAFSQNAGWWGFLLPMAFGAAGVSFALIVVQRFEPDAAGSGVPHLKAVLHHLRGFRWRRILPVKFFGGVSAIGAGLALGREGPTIQMGGAIGQMVSGWFKSTPRETQTLVAAGAGAGLSAAFNAPLAGLVFVLEEVQRDFAPAVFTVTLIASVTADITARYLLGHLPIFTVGEIPIPPLSSLPISLFLGVAAAMVGVLFNRMLVRTADLYQKVAHWPRWVLGSLVGGAIGLVGYFVPGALAGGHDLVEATLAGQLGLMLLLSFFALRFVLTMASYGTGAAGGIFAPMLVLGAALGSFVGQISHTILPEIVTHPQTFAVVGMAALFTAIVRAPLTGIVLMVEMTGEYGLVLPLLVASLTAGGLADYFGDKPIYEVLLKRDLTRWQEKPQLAETLLLELVVAPDAPFDGREVRELGLPPGCILITVHRGLNAEVPTATFKLAAGDRITVVVAPQAAEAVGLLHDGTGSEDQV
jgi:CIC family chloride channel protein